jgi:membrane fusion protein
VPNPNDVSLEDRLMAEPKLFRPEATDAVNESTTGRIILTRTWYLNYITLASTALLVAIAAFILLASYTRRTQLIGQLVPEHGLVKIYASQPGRVVSVKAIEGQRVEAGADLFEISTDRRTASGDASQIVAEQVNARMTALAAEEERLTGIAAQDKALSEDRIRSLEAETAQVRLQLNTARERLAVSQDVASTYEKLQQSDLVTKEQFQQKRAEHLDQLARVQTIQRDLTAVARELSMRRSDMHLQLLKGENEISQLRRQLSGSKQDLAENEAKAGLLLRAPVRGVVTAVTAHIGQFLDPTKPMASIIPGEAKLVAELFAPSSAVGFIRSGQKVLLRVPAFPYQKFGHLSGRVESVSLTSLPSADMPGASIADPRDGRSPEPLYRVLVILDQQSIQAYGEQMSLHAGLEVQADVFQERRKLYEWMLEPLYSVSGRV